MVNQKTLFLFIILIGSFIQSQGKGKTDFINFYNAYTIDFDSLLTGIDHKITNDWEPLGRLLAIEDFMLIYNHPKMYLEDIKRNMGDKSLSESKKMICIIGIQKLELNEYLEVSEYCLELVNLGNLSERVFYFMIFPPSWNTDMRFAENYKLAGVQIFLKKVIHNKNLPWRKSIKRIASGRMLRDRLRMIKQGWKP
ncbi:hypothetical protein [Pedobacter sp. UBA5917]|jgi:hypothetical protein|uniref:hypothetical protein n=1 Tax=Pedobacter sp. UBA5917 TaxID=1947061 RepID=UPI0025E6696D|nr:hypothetical protein [Pedobacter sp. UBA5917]